MKTKTFRGLGPAAAGVLLAIMAVAGNGCTTQTSAGTNTAAITPTQRDYTGQQLQQTGRSNPGAAAAALDPSVGVSNDR
ncbi:MAG: hypothetical protein JO354_04585 [Verrucomicrobia bacterium]|nr:hypothetical protein [Verrucomicrobiota bacterium]